MYKYISHQLSDSQSKFYFTVGDEEQNCKGFEEISYAKFIHLLKSENKDFLKVFYESLNDATDKLSAYFWECIPVSQKLINKKFEFVVTKSEELNNITLDSGPFAKHLADIASAGKCAGSFLNKGKDAILVIPGAKNIIDYKNISQYLHVRIDSYPKYYHFGEYKTEKNQQADNDPSKLIKAKLTPQEAPNNKQENNKGSLPLKDEMGFNQEHLANSSSIEKENTAKTNSQKDKLLLMGGIGAILLIGIGSVIW